MLIKLRNQLKARRKHAINHYRETINPEWLLNELSDTYDDLIIKLAQHINLPANCALAAVGGYGRREMYPHSDVDILILLNNPITSKEHAAALECFIAGLWDIGINASHSVRTVSDCQKLAVTDITTETSLLEARFITGSHCLFKQLASAMQAQLNPQEFFLAKRMEMKQRHHSYHDTPYALEPNCKESPGALRDLQLLLWLAQASGYGSNWREVMQSGAISKQEYKSLLRANNAFKRLRIELHLLAERREDRVLFDLQPALANTYGFKPGNNNQASELLMQRYYWAARIVSQLAYILIQAVEERLFPPLEPAVSIDSSFSVLEQRLDIKHNQLFQQNPDLIFKAFLLVQKNTNIRTMTARTLRALWHARYLIDDKFRTNPENIKLFINILKQPARVADSLYSMAKLNILPRYIPEFRRIVGQTQHDLFHIYTVDEHTLKVVKNLRSFCVPDTAHEHPLASKIMEELKSHWLLYIAALFHDIAKGQGGNHDELGAKYAFNFCKLHNLSVTETKLVVFLVRHHLLMSFVAQKRDLSNPNVIHEFALLIKSKQYLNALYLLTIADIRATNPKVWNSWKGKLLENLYHRTLISLDGNKPDLETVIDQRKKQAISLLTKTGTTEQQYLTLWQKLDTAYFMRHEANEIAWHTEHICSRLNAVEPMVQCRVIGNNEALQVMVWTPDKADLFVRICQFFDHKALSIQDARIHTTNHGWALDSFILILTKQANHKYQDLINSIQTKMVLYLNQQYQINFSINKRKYAPIINRRRATAFPINTQINLIPVADTSYWRLSIVCMDQPALLFKIASVLSSHNIDLKMAKIHTLGDRAEDIFIIQANELNNPNKRVQIESDLQTAIKH